MTQPITNDNSPAPELLTITETAEILRIPVNTLRYWRQLGSGPHSFKVGRHVRYLRSDVLDYIAKRARRHLR